MDDDQVLHDDPALNEDKNKEDIKLRERGLILNELSLDERKDLVDDMRGDAMEDDEDADKLSDVKPPEEDSND